mmetsp:Transcript_25701/g.79001  ORF Transcript_25701/g.79001 Transcript_25701/m.79001 type:complete len:229 (-) Transcript_25701:127-813(-)
MATLVVRTAAPLASLAAVALTAVGMFAPVAGGGMDPKSWFAWHPVLMSLAFPCLMPLGRFPYLAGEGLEPGSRRAVHGAIMALATVAMLLGYLCIFKAHWPAKKFFGYDFKNGQWAPYLRIIHVYLGYLLIAAVLAQAAMGALKMNLLGKGQRAFTFHGQLGKAIVIFGLANTLVAIRFWGWTNAMKVPLYVAVLFAGLFGVVWPRPAKDAGEDEHLLSAALKADVAA